MHQLSEMKTHPRGLGDKIAILLCTYQGQTYLAEQLESLSMQTFKNWVVLASDDGSNDQTLAILKTYQSQWAPDKLTLHTGPHRGFAANFLSLACNPFLSADYFAYADQDDIWEIDKLERAHAWLSTIPKEIPALYCTRTRLVDANNQAIGFSAHQSKSPAFANALIQNIASGNTMVFNAAARALLQAAGSELNVPAHDWWLYLLVSACGGQIYYDPYPSLRYRQHHHNTIGVQRSFLTTLSRLYQHWHARFKHWNDIHIDALYALYEKLTPKNQAILDHFANARQQGLLQRLWGFWRAGLHRQTPLGNLHLLAAAVLNKL